MAIKIAGVDVINDDRELVLAKLTDINSTISSTAVDVFVYDTSKDSDGGAWRHRTQHTSWYNEGASSTRGSRKEFPAVAVIVAEASKVTIYDGDDPSLPMWMVFTAGGGLHNDNNMIGSNTSNGDITCIAATNGVLSAGSNGTAGAGFRVVGFLNDNSTYYGSGAVRLYNGNISERNDGLGNSEDIGGNLVSADVNDVAMTVLPNAPTDPATGLPVPTIAVATDGGVSVIKDDGTVVDYLTAGNAVPELIFLTDGRLGLWLKSSSNSINMLCVTNDPVSAYSADQSNVTTNSNFTNYSGNSDTTPTEALFFAGSGYNRAWHFAATKNGFAGTNAESTGNHALNLVAEDPTTPANGMVAYTTSSYATGWLPGDIKLAALADTDDTDVTGSELVTNGGFTTDTSGWTFEGTATDTSAAGYLEGVTGGATNLLAHTTISTVSGQTYVLTGDIVSGSNTGRFTIGTSAGAVNVASSGFSSPGSTVFITFTAQSTTSYVSIFAGAANSTLRVDNISVRLADPDRSVNGKGLAVHGSITKAAVATGADVVAYSGFSSSNYLEQPYNADLDFGTGDFCVMGWVKHGTSAIQCVAMRQDPSAPSAFGSGASYRFQLYAGNVAMTLPTSSLILSYPTANVGWVFLTWLRRNGVLSIYANGSLLGSSVNTDNLTNTSAITRVGILEYNGGLTDAFLGSLALIRISGTAPTADQIKKIYEDEKVLFQPNAKATLYWDGTSSSPDAVTALAHDPVTDLLHVGTSAGRSVFQGLRRVDNTTTAVSTAISANDSLIVEQ